MISREQMDRFIDHPVVEWAIFALGVILLLLIAYRSAGSIVLSILPLASAAVAGMTAVSARASRTTMNRIIPLRQ